MANYNINMGSFVTWFYIMQEYIRNPKIVYKKYLQVQAGWDK